MSIGRNARSTSLYAPRSEHDFADAHMRFGTATAVKADTALLGTGGILAPPPPPALIGIGDTIPGDTSTTATLIVDAPHTIGTTETIGDQDFYKVTLVAGHDYEIGMYGYSGGPSLIPQADAYVEVYDANGILLAAGDGGAHTLHNNANSGFDVLMTFTAETSGTYYINARAFDQDPTNGTDGDTVGDYELFVQTASPFAYHAYYDLDSPLHSIDWGTQVDGSSRNPDGEEGPRVTGNAETGYAWNPYGIEGKNVITYYFARQGEVFIDEDPSTPGTTDTIVASGFADWEKAAYMQALGAYANVADIVYVEVPSRAEADFVFITYNGTPGPGVSLLGQMNPPDEENEGRSMFNAADERWTEEGLQPGGFSFVTLVHEMGHGHGMAHPHDNGGHSSIMQGVEAEGVAFDYTNGDFDLNQGIYTVMSYEDGWEKSPYGQAETTDPFGWQGSLMAFDIAVIQDKYGVNENFKTGNDTYVITDVNAPGTMYYCIWDANGNDSITYAGAADAVIDLRPATLQYEFGGGGWVSYATGIFGGYTIANSVTIENAVGGSGNDKLTGNDANNFEAGNAGNDMMHGGGGADSLFGDGGNDLVFGDDGNDYMSGGDGADYAEGGLGNDAFDGGAGADIAFGGDGGDNLLGGADNDYMNGGAGNDYFEGGAGADWLEGGADNDILLGGADNDTVIAGSGNDHIEVGDGADLVFAEAGNDTVIGGIGNDYLDAGDGVDYINGGDGNDGLAGGLGADTMVGGAGSDVFHFAAALGGGNIDAVIDFAAGADKIALDDAIFTGLGGGNLDAGAFVIGSGAADASDRIIYNSTTGALLFDADGNGGGAAVQFATLSTGLSLSATDFTVF